jgi:hypothetical protein
LIQIIFISWNTFEIVHSLTCLTFIFLFKSFFPPAFQLKSLTVSSLAEKLESILLGFSLSASDVKVCFTSTFFSHSNLKLYFSYHSKNKLFRRPATLRISLKFDFTFFIPAFHYLTSR